MRCPRACGGETKVINSRRVAFGVTYRRRECLDCGARVTTYERPITRHRPPPPADPAEINHLRAAVTLLQRTDLQSEARALARAALARDWKQCEQIEALALVIIAATPAEAPDA